jgi:hypothetical protein
MADTSGHRQRAGSPAASFLSRSRNNSSPKSQLSKSPRRFLPSLRFSQTILPNLITHLNESFSSLGSIESSKQETRSRAATPRSARKHIPIIIPDYAYPVFPDSPLTPRSEHSHNSDDLLGPVPKIIQPPLPLYSNISRAKHVEIKIPDFIASRYLPDTPTSIEFPPSFKDSESTYPLHEAESSPTNNLTSSNTVSVFDINSDSIYTIHEATATSKDSLQSNETVSTIYLDSDSIWAFHEAQTSQVATVEDKKAINSADPGNQKSEDSDKERKDSAVSFQDMANPLRVNTMTGNMNPNVAVNPSPIVYPGENGGSFSATGVRGGPQGGLPFRLNTQDMTPDPAQHMMTPGSNAGQSPAVSQGPMGTQTTNSNLGLSGFVCNVHRTTGKEPKPLVGATTTILGDKLYVFGGRRLSRTKTQLTSDLYELDLVRRHWTRVECRGDIPPPRYFHSVCSLGDTKLVCYGGMTSGSSSNGKPPPSLQANGQEPPVEMGVLSDIHIFDVPTKSWLKVNATNVPQGRYAHCATILPSSAIFSSAKATLSAIQHNPSSPDAPNQGKLGVQLDGTGGAEMIIVGGQDAANHYIEQISVFNLRSLSWTSTSPLGRACGAYRSVTAPLSAGVASQIGMGPVDDSQANGEKADNPPDAGAAMLIYSNYNFLDVRLELQIHLSDGTLVEKHMQPGSSSPPGLRFPNGGVIDNHFVVSGTFLTSFKQEYALWALDLRSLTWNRIDIGSSTFSQGSWNRGILWARRNAFVILGNRKRSLVEDYNHRRVNFSNMCVVELEAFGLYDNPRKLSPMSGFLSASSPYPNGTPNPTPRGSLMPSGATAGSRVEKSFDNYAAGRELTRSAEELGRMVQASADLADMEFIAINGDHIPANSRLVSRRWGPYFNQLMREALQAAQGDDTATLRPSAPSINQSSRNSSITITPSLTGSGQGRNSTAPPRRSTESPNLELNVNPAFRPRVIFLPHTPQTIHALLHYLYTSSLPPKSSPLCSPQILCSLLQIARPYKIDGLLESVVDRLHLVLDPRNTAAIFNAAAMAAGGGSAVDFSEDGSQRTRNGLGGNHRPESPIMMSGLGQNSYHSGTVPDIREETSRPSTASSTSGTDTASEDDTPGSARLGSHDIWDGSLSAVVGLQKRGLRGLMEGRRIREMGSRDTAVSGNSAGLAGADQVGLGIGRT